MSLAILRAMRWYALLFVLLTTACSPLEPTVLPPATTPSAGVPATLTLTTSGSASSDDRVLINIAVLDATGSGVAGETVFLTTTSGTLQPASVVTSPTGRAQAMLTTTRRATVTAQARTFTTTANVSADTRALSVSVSASPNAPNKGDGVSFAATVTGGAEPYTYAWTFGDGASGSGQSTTHRYFSDGTKSIGVTVTDADSRTGSTTTTLSVQSDPAPPPPPVVPPLPSLSVSLTCTAVAQGSPSPCNVTASYGGSTLLGTAISDADWDWGDGSQTNNVASPIVTHTYGQAGVYSVFVSVTATTVDGAKTATASRSLTIP